MAVEFHDFSIEVKEWIKEKAIAGLYEAAGELVSQVQRNLDKEVGSWFTDQKNAWRYEVDEENLVATIGNPQERSLWTEFGTGEYAQHGDGRKGYWIYVKESEGEAGGSSYAYKGGKSYTLDEAKQIVAMMRDDGLDAHYTKGQRPRKPFQTAYTKLRPVIGRIFEDKFKGG